MTRTSAAAALLPVLFVVPFGSLALAQTTAAGQVHQAFATTTSAAATYSNPSGAFQPLPGGALTVTLKLRSMLIITFAARGTVQGPSSGSTVPIVFMRCEIDGVACQPDINEVEFLYPQGCCDTRSFTWVVHQAARGTHTVRVLWGMGNPTSAIVTNRTLAIEAARLE